MHALDIIPTPSQPNTEGQGEDEIPLLVPNLDDILTGDELAAQKQVEDRVLAVTKQKMDELIGNALLTGKSPF